MTTSAERELYEHPTTVFCDYCKEPITYSEPGSYYTGRRVDPTEFPYNGGPYVITLHDGCEAAYGDEQLGEAIAEFDSPVEVHP